MAFALLKNGAYGITKTKVIKIDIHGSLLFARYHRSRRTHTR